MTAKKSSGSKKSSKVASATTSRTGQVGAAETKVTPVQNDGKDSEPVAGLEQQNPPRPEAGTKAATKEAPARADHAKGVPRKSVEAKFGPKDPDIAETARRQAAVGGI